MLTMFAISTGKRLLSPFAFPFAFLFPALLLLISMPQSAGANQCQARQVKDRPSIGLVLGGGGARGFAHLGVIKKLEELRVPYDFIAGTSMGSIVGGFLATGMNSEEITEVVRHADWNDLLKDKTERQDSPFRRKTDDRLGLFGPKLGLGKDSSLLPKGVISGQKVIFMFESITSQRVHTSDFDALPVPYRAIATDIVSGDMVVIDSGELSMAMRASMAVPGVFDPVQRDGYMLVDGGLVRNLPVDIARSMGADVIIAVDVGTKLAGEDELKNALSIIYQMSGLLTVRNTEIQIETLDESDILISPEIGDLVTSADFDKLDEAIPLGYSATETVEQRLREHSLTEADYQAWRRGVDSCIAGPPNMSFVRLNNQSRFSDEVIHELINVEPGKPLDLAQLDNDLRQIYGLGFIRQARYRIIENDDQQGIEITVLPDERGANFIETGIDLSFSGRGSAIDLSAGYLKTDLDERGSEFRAMLQVGEQPQFYSDYYKPLNDRLTYSFSPSIYMFRRPLLIFDGNRDALAEVKLDEIGGRVAINRDFGRFARLSAGFTRYSGEMDVTIGQPLIEPFSFDGAEAFISLELDRLDDRYLPTRGVYSLLKYSSSIESLGADLDFDQWEFSIYGSHTFGRHNFLWAGIYETSSKMVSNPVNPPIYAWYTAGGFLKMSGYEPNALVGPHFGMVAAGYRYQVAQSGFLPGYIGTTLEYGNAVLDRGDMFSEGLLNGSVYFAYNTPLGPVYLGVGWSEEKSALYFLRLGSIFGARNLGRR
jgi:NTE family protein